jgi:hypothetical protein
MDEKTTIMAQSHVVIGSQAFFMTVTLLPQL